MLLEQIERKHARMVAAREQKEKDMKTGTVPASELDPKKGLRASDYLPDAPDRRPAKTMGLKLPASMHERMEKLAKSPRHKEKSKKAIALRALEIGIGALERG